LSEKRKGNFSESFDFFSEE